MSWVDLLGSVLPTSCFKILGFFYFIFFCCVVKSLQVQLMDSILLVRVLYHVIPLADVVGFDDLRVPEEEK